VIDDEDGYGRIKSSKCKRCKLQYNNRETQCPHCLGLSDVEAAKFKRLYLTGLAKSNTSLGNILTVVTIIFLLLFLSSFLM